MSSPTLDQIATLLPEAQAEVAQLDQQIAADAQANADLAEKLDAATATAAQETQQVTDLTGQLTQAQQDLAKANGAIAQAKLLNDALKSQIADLSAHFAFDEHVIAAINALMLDPTALSFDVLAKPWVMPAGNVGDSGGGNNKPSGTFLEQDTAAGDVFTMQPKYAYNNGYAYVVAPEANDAKFTLYRSDIEFFLPTDADLANAQAIEWEFQQAIVGMAYNGALQAELTGAGLRLFHFAEPKAWQSAHIPFTRQQLAGQHPVKITALFLRDKTAQTLTHLCVWIDGKFYVINSTNPGAQLFNKDGSKYTGSYFHAAFQLDVNSKAAAFSATVDSYKMVVA